MSESRYGHTNVSGGSQNRRERKDAGWESRQGGSQSRPEGTTREPRTGDQAARDDGRTPPPQGTNTQGELAGIGTASDRSFEELQRDDGSAPADARSEAEATGTDQPPRMGGPLGPDPKRRPHLPEGAQDADTRGSGAGGFDRGVNAKVVGAVHQGARPEGPDDAVEPEREPGR
jgi:hypothetical protein